jgi:16S rRNA processing protein RimM
MQHAEDLILLGLFLKTHGIDGHLVLKLFFLPENEPEENEPVFVEVDGLPVPFFIKEFRIISDDTAFVQFDEVNSSTEASAFVNCRVFTDRQKAVEDEKNAGMNYEILEGFRVIDEKYGDSGILREVSEFSENTVMIVDFKGREILIPFHEDIIRNIDYERRIIEITAPSGLLELYLS